MRLGAPHAQDQHPGATGPELLVDGWGFSMEEADVFLSVACDVGITQGCRPAPGYGMIARFKIPKIPACPGPFRP